MLTTAVGARTIYVATNGTQQTPFATWPNAATDVAAAVTIAGAGDLVLLGPGSYYLLAPLVLTQTITMSSVAGAAATTLDGCSTVRCMIIRDAAVVVENIALLNGYVAGASENAAGGCVRLERDGLVRNCEISYGEAAYGGGAACIGGGTLDNCTIGNNAARTAGGGVYCTNGGSVNACSVFNNSAEQHGGGMLLSSGSSVSNSVVDQNTALAHGGGIHCARGGSVVNCRITFNESAEGSGGGVYVDSSGQVNNCVLEDNMAAGNAGGVYLYGGGMLRNSLLVYNSCDGRGGGAYLYEGGTVLNCTLADNNAEQRGGGVFLQRGGTLVNNIICFNTAETNAEYERFGAGSRMDYSCTQPLPSGAGNFTNDPCFLAYANSDYRLAPCSPCIDAGTNLGAQLGVYDVEGNLRVSLTAVDVGAYEYLPEPAWYLWWCGMLVACRVTNRRAIL